MSWSAITCHRQTHLSIARDKHICCQRQKHLSTEINTFIAMGKPIHCQTQTRSSPETNVFIAEDQCIHDWKQTHSSLEANAFIPDICTCTPYYVCDLWPCVCKLCSCSLCTWQSGLGQAKSHRPACETLPACCLCLTCETTLSTNMVAFNDKRIYLQWWMRSFFTTNMFVSSDKCSLRQQQTCLPPRRTGPERIFVIPCLWPVLYVVG